ncbi:MAG: NAD-dependent epimerase/dehydratase family protein [Euzebya sp.]
MSRVLVTGGAGFIGSHLCRFLADTGHDVVALDLMGGPRQHQNAVSLSGVELQRTDLLSTDLRRVISPEDAIVHLAGQPGVQSSWADGFDRHLDGNVRMSQRILEAGLAAGARRIVLASSSSVYGDTFGPLSEDLACVPVSPYGATKAAMELLANSYVARGLPTVCLRYFTTYGPRQRPDMAFHRMFLAGQGGPPFPRRGDGQQTRAYTFVDDVVRATSTALTAPLAPGSVINIAAGQSISLNQALEVVGRLLGRRIPTVDLPAAAGDPQCPTPDTDRARTLLGWSPRVSLSDGLAEQLRWHAPAQRRPVPTRLAS